MLTLPPFGGEAKDFLWMPAALLRGANGTLAEDDVGFSPFFVAGRGGKSRCCCCSDEGGGGGFLGGVASSSIKGGGVERGGVGEAELRGAARE